MANQSRATEDQFNELHSIVTKELQGRISSGEASTADIRAAIEWLKANNITGVAFGSESPLRSLLESIADDVDPDQVNEAYRYGTTEG